MEFKTEKKDDINIVTVQNRCKNCVKYHAKTNSYGRCSSVNQIWEVNHSPEEGAQPKMYSDSHYVGSRFGCVNYRSLFEDVFKKLRQKGFKRTAVSTNRLTTIIKLSDQDYEEMMESIKM